MGACNKLTQNMPSPRRRDSILRMALGANEQDGFPPTRERQFIYATC